MRSLLVVVAALFATEVSAIEPLKPVTTSDRVGTAFATIASLNGNRELVIREEVCADNRDGRHCNYSTNYGPVLRVHTSRGVNGIGHVEIKSPDDGSVANFVELVNVVLFRFEPDMTESDKLNLINRLVRSAFSNPGSVIASGYIEHEFTVEFHEGSGFVFNLQRR